MLLHDMRNACPLGNRSCPTESHVLYVNRIRVMCDLMFKTTHPKTLPWRISCLSVTHFLPFLSPLTAGQGAPSCSVTCQVHSKCKCLVLFILFYLVSGHCCVISCYQCRCTFKMIPSPFSIIILYLEVNSDQSLYLYDGVTETHMQDHMLLEETEKSVLT